MCTQVLHQRRISVASRRGRTVPTIPTTRQSTSHPNRRQRREGGRSLRTPRRRLDAPRQPVERVDPVQLRVARRGRGVEPDLDRLVLPRPHRRGRSLDLAEPTTLRCARLDPELGVEGRLRRADLERPTVPIPDQFTSRVPNLANAFSCIGVADAGLRPDRPRRLARRRRHRHHPRRQALVPRPDGPAVRGREAAQRRLASWEYGR